MGKVFLLFVRGLVQAHSFVHHFFRVVKQQHVCVTNGLCVCVCCCGCWPPLEFGPQTDFEPLIHATKFVQGPADIDTIALKQII